MRRQVTSKSSTLGIRIRVRTIDPSSASLLYYREQDENRPAISSGRIGSTRDHPGSFPLTPTLARRSSSTVNVPVPPWRHPRIPPEREVPPVGCARHPPGSPAGLLGLSGPR